MTLAAVVVAYRDADVLDRCLASLGPIADVVVTNVTADPAVSAVVRSRGRQEVRVDANVGYAAGVNLAVERLPSACTTVMFLNDDVRLCSAPPAPGGAAVRIPRQRTPEGSDVAVVHRLPSPFGFCREWILGRRPPQRGGDVGLRQGTFANAAAVIAPRTVLESHPLPGEYFLYWEEAAWFWRLADARVPVLFDETVVERPPGAAEYSTLKARLLGENLIRLAVERYGQAAASFYLGLGCAWLCRLAVSDSWRSDRSERWAARRETLRGLTSAYRSIGRRTVGAP